MVAAVRCHRLARQACHGLGSFSPQIRKTQTGEEVRGTISTSIFADKKADCPLGKLVGGSHVEEVELRGGQEVPHLPAPGPGCQLFNLI